jgi:very-short-patch-repair endonuclease
MRKKTKEEYIKDFNIIFKGKYTFPLTQEFNTSKKLLGICPEHGEFYKYKYQLIKGKGCPKCSKNRKKTRVEHLNDCKSEYDYSLITQEWWDKNYKNTNTKIPVICPEHGEFTATLASIKDNKLCPSCYIEQLRKPKKLKSDYLNLLKKIHNSKYQYKEDTFVNTSTKMIVICPEHGEFEIIPSIHKQGVGCKKCYDKRRGKSLLKSRDEVLIDFKNIHQDKYDYSKVNYINNKNKVEIVCPEHGPFLQTPNDHKNGSGCPKCNSSKGEKHIRNYLLENSFSILEQYSFKELPNLRFDFYLEDYNLAIEYDGIQHFEVIEHFGGEKALASCKERDLLKNQYCKDNNIYLLRIPYWEYDNIEKLIQKEIEYIYIKGKI